MTATSAHWEADVCAWCDINAWWKRINALGVPTAVTRQLKNADQAETVAPDTSCAVHMRTNRKLYVVNVIWRHATRMHGAHAHVDVNACTKVQVGGTSVCSRLTSTRDVRHVCECHRMYAFTHVYAQFCQQNKRSWKVNGFQNKTGRYWHLLIECYITWAFVTITILPHNSNSTFN